MWKAAEPRLLGAEMTAHRLQQCQKIWVWTKYSFECKISCPYWFGFITIEKWKQEKKHTCTKKKKTNSLLLLNQQTYFFSSLSKEMLYTVMFYGLDIFCTLLVYSYWVNVLLYYMQKDALMATNLVVIKVLF